MEALTPGEDDLLALALESGLLIDDPVTAAAALAFAVAVVQACADIGDGYWLDDTSAGHHIRATFIP